MFPFRSKKLQIFSAFSILALLALECQQLFLDFLILSNYSLSDTVLRMEYIGLEACSMITHGYRLETEVDFHNAILFGLLVSVTQEGEHLGS